MSRLGSLYDVSGWKLELHRCSFGSSVLQRTRSDGQAFKSVLKNSSVRKSHEPFTQKPSNAESAAGLEPIGLAGSPGLRNVTRLGDPAADTLRQPADFYSPDTFNYNVLDVSADGKILTITSYGINSTVQNGFVEYDPVNNPEQELFSFQIKRHP